MIFFCGIGSAFNKWRKKNNKNIDYWNIMPIYSVYSSLKSSNSWEKIDFINYSFDDDSDDSEKWKSFLMF
jgi:hypothetical protein